MFSKKRHHQSGGLGTEAFSGIPNTCDFGICENSLHAVNWHEFGIDLEKSVYPMQSFALEMTARKNEIAVLAAIPMLILAASTGAAFAAKPGFGNLYYEGEIMRTLVPPSAFPNEGRDPIYSVTNGVTEQVGIASVAPGDKGYHGGAWAVYLVTFSSGVTPYLLTSQEQVLDAEDAGDVTIERATDLDFRCPIQP